MFFPTAAEKFPLGYVCPQPGCEFKDKHKFDNLRMHIERTHLGIKRYGCGYCPYEAYHEGEVNKHVSLVHFCQPHGKKIGDTFSCQGWSNKPFTCKELVELNRQCGYGGRRKADMKKHHQIYHEGVKEYRCDLKIKQEYGCFR